MNNKLSKTWSFYDAGKNYKRRIGLYETARRNERYYRGEQWGSSNSDELPRPVFNIIRRITDYLICTVASGNVRINYSDENLPFIDSSMLASIIEEGINAMSKNAAYRWERCKMDHLIYRLLLDAALSGDGVIYCYWDSDAESGQSFSGDIVTELIDSTNIFPADPTHADIQSQEYIILSGRQSVSSLKREAEEHGATPDDIERIIPDDSFGMGAGDLSAYELEGDDSAKATYLIKFWKEDGLVCFEKSTRDCIIKRAKTACKLYPVAYFNWYPTKNSFHGTSPISGMIPNQNFINRAYALLMKHMTDSAFSKVIYDKTKIPEWSNRVGEAIAAMGGGNIGDAVSVVGTGQMQNGYTELINQATAMTKELSGATDSALGNVVPTNTSAIIALQESSRLPLEQVRASFSRCIEDMANIWADMMCAYYPKERLLPYYSGSSASVTAADFSILSKELIRARVDIGTVSHYSDAGTQAVLDKLLDGGHITAIQYLEQLPGGAFGGRYALVEELRQELEKKATAPDGEKGNTDE